MPIINRLARLFKADIHAVLDHIEEPEQQLKQSIREMANELANVEHDIKAGKLELDNLADQKKTISDRITQAEDEINVCLTNNNDKLAREFIRRKLESLAVLSNVDGVRAKTQKHLKKLEEQHKEYTSLLTGMQQKAELIGSYSDRNQHLNTAQTINCAVSEDDIEVALLKEQELFNHRSKAS